MAMRGGTCGVSLCVCGGTSCAESDFECCLVYSIFDATEHVGHFPSRERRGIGAHSPHHQRGQREVGWV